MNAQSFRFRSPAVLGVLAILAVSCGRRASSPEGQTGADARALEDFNHRLQEYVKVHQRAEAYLRLPHIKATNSGEKIVKRQYSMAAKIRWEGANAKEGTIFTPEIRAYFDRAINSAYRANEEGIQASLECITPLDEKKLKPNVSYPESAEYQVMPPTILLHIPKLPPELEYRIVNRDLLLRDVEANLIIDIMRDAIRPGPGRRICPD